MGDFQDHRYDFIASNPFGMDMKKTDNYNQILKELGFSNDIEYNVKVLNGIGAYITNVDKDFDLANVKEGSMIYECINAGGQIAIDKPLPLNNGMSPTNQVGVYCTNYKDVFPIVYPINKESSKTK